MVRLHRSIIGNIGTLSCSFVLFEILLFGIVNLWVLLVLIDPFDTLLSPCHLAFVGDYTNLFSINQKLNVKCYLIWFFIR